MKREERIKRAKSRLLIEHPLFGSLATILKFEESDNIKNFQVSNTKLLFNSDYIDSLNDEELIFVIANAALHQSQIYQKRRSNRSKWLWELSVDHTINSILIQNNLTPAPDINYEKAFDDMYAEEIYETLRERIKDKSENREDEDGKEDERVDVNKSSKSQKVLLDREKDEELSDLISKILSKYLNSDDIPKGIKRVVKRTKLQKIGWKERLFRYINTHIMSDYRLYPPNKKFLYMDYALPSVYGEQLEIAIAIDTSASIDDELLAVFLTELKAIMSLFDNYKIELIECDEKIQNIQILNNLNDLDSRLKGGGGTDFREVFEYLNRKRDIKFLIYFSDGEGIFPDVAPHFDTLWVTPKEFSPPFGELLLIK